MDSATNYVTFLPKQKEHKHTLIWLHGLGDSADGFKGIFGHPAKTMVPPTCKVVLPTAPIRPVTINNGMEMTSWYDIMDLSGAGY